MSFLRHKLGAKLVKIASFTFFPSLYIRVNESFIFCGIGLSVVCVCVCVCCIHNTQPKNLKQILIPHTNILSKYIHSIVTHNERGLMLSTCRVLSPLDLVITPCPIPESLLGSPPANCTRTARQSAARFFAANTDSQPQAPSLSFLSLSTSSTPSADVQMKRGSSDHT